MLAGPDRLVPEPAHPFENAACAIWAISAAPSATVSALAKYSRADCSIVRTTTLTGLAVGAVERSPVARSAGDAVLLPEVATIHGPAVPELSFGYD